MDALFSFVTLSDQLFIHDPSVVWWYRRSVHLPGLTDNYSMRPRVARQALTPWMRLLRDLPMLTFACQKRQRARPDPIDLVNVVFDLFSQ